MLAEPASWNYALDTTGLRHLAGASYEPAQSDGTSTHQVSRMLEERGGTETSSGSESVPTVERGRNIGELEEQSRRRLTSEQTVPRQDRPVSASEAPASATRHQQPVRPQQDRPPLPRLERLVPARQEERSTASQERPSSPRAVSTPRAPERHAGVQLHGHTQSHGTTPVTPPAAGVRQIQGDERPEPATGLQAGSREVDPQVQFEETSDDASVPSASGAISDFLAPNAVTDSTTEKTSVGGSTTPASSSTAVPTSPPIQRAAPTGLGPKPRRVRQVMKRPADPRDSQSVPEVPAAKKAKVGADILRGRLATMVTQPKDQANSTATPAAAKTPATPRVISEQETKNAFAKVINVRARDFEWRSEKQRLAALSVMSGANTTIVLPTSGGKTACALAPCTTELDSVVSVMIVPFTAIAEQVVQMGNTANIRARVWTETTDPIASRHQLVVAVPETAVCDTFMAFLSQLHERGNLRRIIIDEAHMSADLSHTSFRKSMSLLYRVTTLPGIQVVLLTGTLPPVRLHAYRDAYLLNPHRIIRDSTVRQNIQYEIKFVTGKEAYKEEAVALAEREVQKTGKGKVLVFCFSVQLAEDLQRRYHYPCYHAEVEEGTRKEILEGFRLGRTRILFATSSLGAGLDVEDVTMVVHAGTPHSLTDYLQETGRAGRSGNFIAKAVMMLSKEKKIYDYTEADVENLDKLLIGCYVDTDVCLITFQHAYLDGKAVDRRKSMCTEGTTCSNCAAKSETQWGFVRNVIAQPNPFLRNNWERLVKPPLESPFVPCNPQKESLARTRASMHLLELGQAGLQHLQGRCAHCVVMYPEDQDDHFSEDCPWVPKDVFAVWKAWLVGDFQSRNFRTRAGSWPGCQNCLVPNDMCTGHTACKDCREGSPCSTAQRPERKCSGPCKFGLQLLRCLFSASHDEELGMPVLASIVNAGPAFHYLDRNNANRAVYLRSWLYMGKDVGYKQASRGFFYFCKLVEMADGFKRAREGVRSA